MKPCPRTVSELQQQGKVDRSEEQLLSHERYDNTAKAYL